MSGGHGQHVYDVLGRMSDDEDEDEVPEDMDVTFVPASKRPVPAASTAQRGGRALVTSASNTAATTTARERTETVYEQERNAKVRQLLAEQQKSAPGVVFSLDAYEVPLSDPHVLAAFAEAADRLNTGQADTDGPRRGSWQQQQQHRGGRGGEGGERGGWGGPRRLRMPHPNMSEEEQARFVRHRRNMAVTRNALREVDPDTLEYMQVTQAADQLPPSRGRDSFALTYRGGGRGVGGMRGGGGDWRGRGGRGGRGGSGGSGGSGFRPY
ncbi:hypothetical protein NESM_000332600 [Novymonas esmeraldas]|uniref:Uncharacterized protein n=1 Tax=Novymonas esmeraldas TaxID=1808958 RepID=A0AAW0ELP0_9TRYP